MLIKDVSIFTNNGRYIPEGFVRVDNGKIVEIGEGNPNFLEGEEILSFRGKLLLPGFVNAHTHFYSTFARGMFLDRFDPNSFAELLEQLWWRLDRKLTLDDVRLSAAIGAVESLKAGVTSVIDHHSSPNSIKGSLEQIAKAVNEVGLRCATCYEVSDRDGEDATRFGIEENLDFFETRNEFRAGYFGLHASFTLSDDTLERVSNAVKGKIPVHVHVAEGPEDEEQSVNRYGVRIIERFHKHGLLARGSIFAHCIHVDDSEVDLIKESDSYIVVNVQSNINNGVGISYWPKFLEKGLNVGVGNDGFGFNLSHDLRFFILTPHHLKRDPRVSSVDDLAKTFFSTNYEIASNTFGIKLGKIEPGYAADMIVIDYNNPTPLSAENFLGHFFFGIIDNLNVTDAFVAGQHVLKNKKVVGVSEEELYKEARKLAEKLWKRL